MQTVEVDVWNKASRSYMGITVYGKLSEWGFTPFSSDPRVLIKRNERNLLIVAVVLDDMAFFINSRPMLKWLKGKLSVTFDVKLMGPLK